MALALAGAGARVGLVARDVDQLAQVAAEASANGDETAPFRADVSDEAQVQALAQSVSEKLGPVDILVNNAGINIRRPLIEYSLEEWRHVMDTNLTSAFLMSRAFIPQMKGRGYGRVINITSTMAHVSLPMRSAYSASKAGLLGMTRTLALELAPDQITVVAISPGPFATEMNAAAIANPEQSQFFTSRTALGRWGKLNEVSKLAVFLCSEDASFITGTDILVDGGWCAQ